MKSGFAVIGDTQFLPGYCVLLSYPKVDCLNDLSIVDRQAFLTDMTLIGDAITKTCNPLRINYEILGNLDNFLHAHIFPRYEWEEESIRKGPVFKYPSENWSLTEYQFCEDKYGELKKFLTDTLNGLINKSYKQGLLNNSATVINKGIQRIFSFKSARFFGESLEKPCTLIHLLAKVKEIKRLKSKNRLISKPFLN